MKFIILGLLTLFSHTAFSLEIELKDSSTSESYCDSTNPRCFFDFRTKRNAQNTAKSRAKNKTEAKCIHNGGSIVSSESQRSSCSKIRAWIDYYICSASHKVICETSPNNDLTINHEVAKRCSKTIGAVALVRNGSHTINFKQINSACDYASATSSNNLLLNCMSKSLNHDRGASVYYALRYCDITNRQKRIQEWIDILPFFPNNNFLYIYENKF